MLQSRPNRDPNLTITNLHVKEDDDGAIYYNFAESRDKTLEKCWEIPTNSTFMPTEEILPNTDYAVWSIEIKEPYVTAKGKQRTRTRFDWEWIEPLAHYRVTSMSATTRTAKGKLLREAHSKVIEAQNNFNSLFDELFPEKTAK